VTELLDSLLAAVQDSPLLLAFLVVLGGLVWATERLSGTDGPLTRLVRAWQDRELHRLRRERALAAEQRASVQETKDARVRELEAEVEWLEGELRDLRRRDRVRDEYLHRLADASRRAGVRIDDAPDLPPLYVDGDASGLPTVTIPTAGPSTAPIAGRRNSARHAAPPR
jgi:hypothetical protein